jgi:hypothetical protein
VRLRLQLKKVAVELADAVADASAEEVTQKIVPLKCKVVVVDVDASRANLAAALKSTLADTAGELLVRYGR